MISIVIGESRKLGHKYSMFVSFPYNEEIITVIRNLPQRIWLADTKQWEVPVNKLEKLLKAFPEQEFDISGTYIDLTPKAEIPDGFEFKTKPFQHQIEGFNYGLANDKWFLGDEQGLGKTKQVIDIAIAKKLQHGYKHCLIICGVNGLKYNWQNEIKIHSNEAGWILGNRYNTRSKKWRIGSSQDKLNDLINIDNIKEYFIITNVETLRYKEDTGEKNKRGKKIYDYPITDKLIELCNNHEIDMIAFDEFHKCFEYNTPIITDKGILNIGDIVSNKLNVKVASYNEQLAKIEYKSIVNYFENHVNQNLLELQFGMNNGEIKTIRCTQDHKFFTKNRGWINAIDLNENDDILEY